MTLNTCLMVIRSIFIWPNYMCSQLNVKSINKASSESDSYAVILSHYSKTSHMIALSWKHWHFLPIYCLLSIHCTDIWLHSCASDVTQWNLWPLSPGRHLSSTAQTMWWRCFLSATESCCTINLLLCSCCFFVWDEEQRDFVVTVRYSLVTVLSAQYQYCVRL